MDQRRETLHAKPGFERRGFERRPASTPGRHVAKGHDAILKALQEGGKETTVITLSGEKFIGKIVGRDKFTITVARQEISPVDGDLVTIRRVFYKHAIEQFFSVEA